MFGKDQECVSAGDPVRQMASGTISISDVDSFKMDGQRQSNRFFELRYSRCQDSTARKWSKPLWGKHPQEHTKEGESEIDSKKHTPQKALAQNNDTL